MSELVRALWLGRAWTTVLVLGLAFACAALPSPAPFVIGALAVALEFAANLATLRLLRGLRADDGELLYQNGLRLRVSDLRATQLVERAEAWVGLAFGSVAAVDMVVSGRAAGLALVVPASLLLLGIGVNRRYVRLLSEALRGLHGQEPERTYRIARSLANATPDVRSQASRLEALAVLQRGDVEGGLARLEEQWTGALDGTAVTLGLLRLHRGDPSLLRRWLDADRPEDRYQRYVADLVRGNLALCAGEPAAVLAAVRPSMADLPPYYARELRILEVAALRALGRADDARAALATVVPPIETEPWRERAYPLVWRLVRGEPGPSSGGAVERRAPAQVSAPADAFAPPGGQEEVLPPRRRRREVGALPAEWLPIDSARPPWRRVLLGVLAAVLLGLTALALPLLLLGAFVFGTEDPALLAAEAGVVAVALVVGVGLAVELLTGLRKPVRPAIRLADGRLLARWPTAGNVGVLALLTAIMLGGGLALWLQEEGGFAGAGLAWALALLFGLALIARIRAVRLVRALHEAPPDQALAVAQRVAPRATVGGSAARPWVALAHLWNGDLAGAQRELDEAATFLPDVRELAAWLRAARGEIDLDHLLRRPEPDKLGPEYRHAVTCALAALQAGRADRVLARAERWTSIADQLPNRFGALLHHLVLAVRVAAADPGAEAYRAAHPEITEAAWVARAWPFTRVDRS